MHGILIHRGFFSLYQRRIPLVITIALKIEVGNVLNLLLHRKKIRILMFLLVEVLITYISLKEEILNAKLCEYSYQINGVLNILLREMLFLQSYKKHTYFMCLFRYLQSCVLL